MVLWLGSRAPMIAPPSKPTTAPAATRTPLPGPSGPQTKLPDGQGFEEPYAAAPAPAPAPAPTPAPIRVLRRRCLLFMSLTMRTACFGMVCSPDGSRSEIAVSETFRNVPEPFFEFAFTTWIFWPACNVLRFCQDAWLDCAHEAEGNPRMQIRGKNFRTSALPIVNFG